MSARNYAMLLALVLVLSGLLCAVVVSKAMVSSLRELKEATEKISKGDLDVKLKIRSGDEVGDLANSFERMIAAIKFFREGEKDE
ncbi:MAG: HAMP domain-containing protein, partial [Planctomycetes bacterium]|nr:HAMP domain-containing protein [Planctomycetota bacterium]